MFPVQPTPIPCGLTISRWAAGVAFILLGIGGCESQAPNLRGEGFHDEFATWGEKKRAPDSDGDLGGFSTKAQQIERNLGVR
jgi:hypothetical protein